ncbi:hypothetical protein CO151_13470 [bacterium CG_4_9_14_3_um_filter_65_15]|nr:MAG: hypothetical protein CO151_13470 [bacterium CG_4_9_14_3_um_filter_65_15]
MNKRWIGLSIILIVAAVLVLLGWLKWEHGKIFPSTDNAYIGADVTAVSSRVPGTLLLVAAQENHSVQEGEVIAELDPRDFDQDVAKQEAAVGAAQADVALQEALIAGARAQVAAAEAQLRLAQSDRERYAALDESGSTARRQYDQAIAAASVAEAGLDAARKQLTATRAGLEAQQKALAKANTGLDNARLQRSYCTITAPCSGVITDKGAMTGQVVAPGQPLCRIVQTNGAHAWIDANFKETQLRRIRIGQPVTLTIDADGQGEYRGHVASLGAGSGAAFSLLPPENATGNWIKVVQRLPVRIALDETIPERLLKIGLSCAVTVDTSDLED